MSLSLLNKKSLNSTQSNKTVSHNSNNQYSRIQKLGNQTIQKLIKSRILQPKLKISQPDDPYEREADRVADQIMRMPYVSHENKIQRKKCSTCQMKDNEKKEDELKISRKANLTNSNLTTSDEISNQIMSTGGGRSLDSSTKSFMEPRFDHDFSDVRIHDNSKAVNLANSVNAKAFTIGNNIFMGENETISDKRLMAHELTHVVQQRNSTSRFILNRKKITGIKLGEQLIQKIRETIANKKNDKNWKKKLEDLFNEATDKKSAGYLYNRLHTQRNKKGGPAVMVSFFRSNLESSYATKLLDILRNKIGIKQETKPKKKPKEKPKAETSSHPEESKNLGPSCGEEYYFDEDEGKCIKYEIYGPPNLEESNGICTEGMCKDSGVCEEGMCIGLPHEEKKREQEDQFKIKQQFKAEARKKANLSLDLSKKYLEQLKTNYGFTSGAQGTFSVGKKIRILQEIGKKFLKIEQDIADTTIIRDALLNTKIKEERFANNFAGASGASAEAHMSESDLKSLKKNLLNQQKKLDVLIGLKHAIVASVPELNFFITEGDVNNLVKMQNVIEVSNIIQQRADLVIDKIKVVRGKIKIEDINVLDLDRIVSITKQDSDFSSEYSQSVITEMIDDHKTKEFLIDLGITVVSVAALVAAPFTGGATAIGLTLFGVGTGIVGGIMNLEEALDLLDASKTDIRKNLSLFDRNEAHMLVSLGIIETVLGVLELNQFIKAAKHVGKLFTSTTKRVVRESGEAVVRESGEAVVRETNQRLQRTLDDIRELHGSKYDEIPRSLINDVLNAYDDENIIFDILEVYSSTNDAARQTVGLLQIARDTANINGIEDIFIDLTSSGVRTIKGTEFELAWIHANRNHISEVALSSISTRGNVVKGLDVLTHAGSVELKNLTLTSSYYASNAANAARNIVRQVGRRLDEGDTIVEVIFSSYAGSMPTQFADELTSQLRNLAASRGIDPSNLTFSLWP